MLVQVDGQELLSVKGDPGNLDSQGFLCIRGQASREIFGNPNRLARREQEPQVWLAPADAAARHISDGSPIRLYNARGSLAARAHVTARMQAGAVWVRDGWPGLNQLTAGAAVLPDRAVDVFAFSAGQSSFDAKVEVACL